MLASRWTDLPEDLNVLSELATIPLVDLRRAIADASRGSDPAIRNVRNVFVFTSLEEAFLEFGNRVSSDLASRWAEIATSVLLDPNPYEGLNSHERIAAQMKGQRRTYSPALRRGIADSLALAGAIESVPGGTNHASSVAERVVRDVLRQVSAGSKGHTWGAIADVLPLLAEALQTPSFRRWRMTLQPASRPSAACSRSLTIRWHWGRRVNSITCCGPWKCSAGRQTTSFAQHRS